jgi:hypothetical protein
MENQKINVTKQNKGIRYCLLPDNVRMMMASGEN